MMFKKNKIIFLLTVLLSIAVLSSCSHKVYNDKDKQEQADLLQKKDFISQNSSEKKQPEDKQGKENKYVEDDTTQVLIDAEINPKDIVRVYQHGDHWHVFTKDGREHITYKDPNSIEEQGLALVSVVGLKELKDLDVAEIKIHGDHYHVYTKDGTEYLTYENPSSLFPNIKVQKYVGSHGNPKKAPNISPVRENFGKAHGPKSKAKDGKASSSAKNDDPRRIVSILVHDDHWHLYDAEGNEYVTYSDPSSLYPDASYGVYVGTHADYRPKNKSNNLAKGKNQNSLNHGKEDGISGAGSSSSIARRPNYGGSSSSSSSSHADSGSTNGGLKLMKPPFHPKGLVSVVNDAEKLKKLGANLVLQHEDHFHIYTNDKKEYISNNPDTFSILNNVEHGLYEGSHGGPVDPIDEGLAIIGGNDEVSGKVKYAWEHGNHWHLHDGNKKGLGVKYYIDADGLRNLYPGIVILPFKLPSEAQAWENEGKFDGIKVDSDEEFTQKQKFLARKYGVSPRKVIRNADKLTVEINTDHGYITVNLDSLDIVDGQVKEVKDLPKVKGEENQTTAENGENTENAENITKEEDQSKDQSDKSKDKTNGQANGKTDETKEETKNDKEPQNTEAIENQKENNNAVTPAETTTTPEPKEKNPKPKTNPTEIMEKEKANLQKLSEKLSLNEEEVIDKIFEVEELDGVPIADLKVNEDGTVSHNDKTYKLKEENP